MKSVLVLAAAALVALSVPAMAGDGLGGCMGYHQVVQSPAPAATAAAPSAPAMTPVPSTTAASEDAEEKPPQTASTRIVADQHGS